MTLFSKETISSQTPFLKMILYLMILIKKSRKRPCDRLPGQPKGKVGSIPIRFQSDASVICFRQRRKYIRQRQKFIRQCRKQLTLASKQKHIAILHQTFARAWSRSSRISSIYSVPILRRTVEGVICCPASSSGVI